MEEGDGRGVARGKGRESQEVSGKKEGVKTGKKKKKAEEGWKKEGVKTGKKKKKAEEGWKKEGVKTENKKKEEKGVGGRKKNYMYVLLVCLPWRSMQLPESHSAPDRSEYHHCPRHRSVVCDTITTVSNTTMHSWRSWVVLNQLYIIELLAGSC